MSRPLHLATYLMAYDTRAQALQDRTRAGFLLRAAALAELAHRGDLVEDGRGRVLVAPGAGPAGDPVLDAVLAEVAARRRRWKSWIKRGREETLDAVEQRLAVLGVLTVRDRDPYGPVVPRRPVAMPDPREALDRQLRVAQLVRGDEPVGEVAFADAVLAALAAHGQVRLVLSRQEQRAHAGRIAALTARLGERAPGLAKAVDGLGTTMVAAQGGMGGG
ncbi:GPP34 family phosphoprotein [Kitasatospora sp. NPDC059973]|uniref:GPP34 family phosphoprotein n=1 Tax=Kitasatospora sp. NPDC059973 TaxID=3347020 RepID=UPI0036C78D6C